MHQNELSILEFIHMIVETYDSYFEGVCELDVSTLYLTGSLWPAYEACIRAPFWSSSARYICITFLAALLGAGRMIFIQLYACWPIKRD